MSYELYCGFCGKECATMIIDEGYGSTHYGSAFSIHHDYRHVSECCGEALYMDKELIEPLIEPIH